ncbi:hypothetical protein MHUMG1_08340 [Metarhizium humberi]|uniref:Uncharacterized protein n=1 Tax=Metarhizium humberi TaxID=2596975 RepID=A0A9P8S4Q8_9HYPO|nr:hypothetical protein MHUMG1_08340 [Metarhizium humberi]
MGAATFILFLCALAANAVCKTNFTQPPANGPNANYQDNPVYQQGQKIDVQWKSDLDTMDLFVFQQYPAAGKGVQFLKKLRGRSRCHKPAPFPPVDQSHLDRQSRRAKQECAPGRKRHTLLCGAARQEPGQGRYEPLLQRERARRGLDDCTRDPDIRRAHNVHDDVGRDGRAGEFWREQPGPVQGGCGRRGGRQHSRRPLAPRRDGTAGVEEDAERQAGRGGCSLGREAPGAGGPCYPRSAFWESPS